MYFREILQSRSGKSQSLDSLYIPASVAWAKLEADGDADGAEELAEKIGKQIRFFHTRLILQTYKK